MARRRFKSHVKGHSTFFLNLNSMTDMFTIMLVFLLQTYSTADVEIVPHQGLRLPTSSNELNPTEGVRIVLSKDELLIDKTKLATLSDRQFSAKDVDGKDPNFLPQLFNELSKRTNELPDKAEVKEGRILLQADAGLPYETLKKVMYTASMAGYPQLKMITMVGN